MAENVPPKYRLTADGERYLTPPSICAENVQISYSLLGLSTFCVFFKVRQVP